MAEKQGKGLKEKLGFKKLRTKLGFRKRSSASSESVSSSPHLENSQISAGASTARLAVDNRITRTLSSQSAAETLVNVSSIPNSDKAKDSARADTRSDRERAEVAAADESHVVITSDGENATGSQIKAKAGDGMLGKEVLELKGSIVAPTETKSNGLWEFAYQIVEQETNPDFRLSENERLWLQEAKSKDFWVIQEELWCKMRANDQAWELEDQNGHKLSIRNRVHKILKSVNKYSTVVSTGINHSPEIISLVWAGLQFMVNVALNRLETLKCLEEAVSTITEQMAYGEFYATMYSGSLKLEDGLETREATEVLKKIAQEALPQLYAAILVFLLKARTYFDKEVKDFGARIADYLIPFSESLEPFIKRIEAVRKTLEGLADAAVMERTKASSEKIEKIEKLLKDQNTIRAIQDGKFALAELNKRVAGGAFFDSKITSEHKNICLPGTRKDLLEEILRWSRSSDPATKSIYWLTGMGGTGKSTIAMTVAQTFDNEGRLGGSFFFDRDQAGLGLNDAINFFPTLAAKLIRRIPELLPFVQEELKDPLILDANAVQLDRQARKLILEPLQHFASRKLASRHETHMSSEIDSENPIILVIDALDECNSKNDKDSKIILEALAAIGSIGSIGSIRIRIFITSRPEVHIRTGFCSQALQDRYGCFNLRDIETQIVDEDIKAYLRYELRKIWEEVDIIDMPADATVERLCENAHQLFIYATTVCRLLHQLLRIMDHERALAIALAQYRGLDKLYSGVLKYATRAFEDDGFKHLKEEMGVLNPLARILGYIVILFTPLPPSSISKLLTMETRIVVDFLDYLRSILEVSQDEKGEAGNVRFLHPSFRDFIVDEARCESFWVDQSRTHEDVFLRCIEIMSDTLKENICSLPSPGSSPTDVKEGHLELALPITVRYACRYWIQHLQKSHHDGILKHEEKIGTFLKMHFLHWLEALSLLGIVPEGVREIKALRSDWTLKAQPGGHLHELLRHAERFIVKHRWIIENAPLQTYISAITFSPRSLPFGSIPRWIKTICPQRADDWDPLLQTIVHADGLQEVYAIAFSPDGKLLASGGDDGKIYIWDVATGALCGGPLEGHRSWTLTLTSVAFSPDGKLIASGCKGGTVRLWDVATSTLVNADGFFGHESFVNSVAFSPDGEFVASGSEDKTIRLWNVATGNQINVTGFLGHKNTVYSVTFSPNGKFLASGSFGEIRLWNVDTGMPTFSTGNLGILWMKANCVVFSPDGERLASCSGGGDPKIQIWNVTSTGTLSDTGTDFLGHTDAIDSVAFCPDGKRIASTSDDQTARIWDVSTGNLLATFKLHANRSVRAVVFSPNGELLATAADASVSLWDALVPTGPRPEIQLLEGHTEEVSCLAFSPNGNLVVSGSDDSTLRLWDISTGVSTATFEGHTSTITAITFSTDGNFIASGSHDKTVRLWDVAKGVSIATFEGHSDWINAVTFSPNGEFLASSSFDKTVRLWDVAEGVSIATWVSHHNCIYVARFSPDGKLLAWGSQDGRVRLWDVAKKDSSFDTFKGRHTAGVQMVTFSPDGKHLASGSSLDKTVWLWDLTTKQRVYIFKTDLTTLIREVAFTKDGNFIKTNAGVSYVGPLADGGSEGHEHDIPVPFVELDWYLIDVLGEQWIAYGDQKVLWLPPDYRDAKFGSRNDTLVFGLKSGEVAMFKCNRQILEELGFPFGQRLIRRFQPMEYQEYPEQEASDEE